MKVLLIDDNLAIREVIKEMILSIDETIVDEASDGEEGFEYFKDNTDIDIIISDYDMPILNGLDMFKKINEYIKENNLKIPYMVLQSANMLSDDFLEELELLNIKSILKKPYTISKLENTFKNYGKHIITKPN